MEEFIKLAKENYSSKENIDADVLSKLKEQNVPLMTVLKVLGSLGFTLSEGQEIVSKSKYYNANYNNAAILTEDFIDFVAKRNKE